MRKFNILVQVLLMIELDEPEKGEMAWLYPK